MNPYRNILYFILVFLLQLAITDYLYLGPWVTVCILPLLILLMPLSWSPHRVMIVAFALGLGLDVLSAGVVGLNAFAAVMAAAPRRMLYRVLVNSDRQDTTEVLILRQAGFEPYFKMLLALTALYLAAFILLDCVSLRPAGFILGKFLASTVVSTLLGLVLSLSVKNR